MDCRWQIKIWSFIYYIVNSSFISKLDGRRSTYVELLYKNDHNSQYISITHFSNEDNDLSENGTTSQSLNRTRQIIKKIKKSSMIEIISSSLLILCLATLSNRKRLVDHLIRSSSFRVDCNADYSATFPVSFGNVSSANIGSKKSFIFNMKIKSYLVERLVTCVFKIIHWWKSRDPVK